jgi:hypothetical protein
MSSVQSKEGQDVQWRRSGTGEASQEQINRNFKVVIRVRPPLPRELTPGLDFQSDVRTRA